MNCFVAAIGLGFAIFSCTVTAQQATPMIENVFKGRCVETTAKGFAQARKVCILGAFPRIYRIYA